MKEWEERAILSSVKCMTGIENRHEEKKAEKKCIRKHRFDNNGEFNALI